VGSPSITRDSTFEGTELPEISKSPRAGDEPDVAEAEEPELEPRMMARPCSPVASYDLTAAQREEEMESKNQAARALVEERRVILENQELQRRQKEQTQKRQQRHDRHKKMRAGSVEKSNRGPGSESEDEAKQTSDSDHSFVESSDEENPFELCYSPDKNKPTNVSRELSGYHKPDNSGYQQEKDERKVRIEDSYKGVEHWEPGQGGVASCWSGVVSQLCGSSTQIWLNLPLVSMFAYDPVPDADT